jgi:hypothetical protein
MNFNTLLGILIFGALMMFTIYLLALNQNHGTNSKLVCALKKRFAL